MKLDRRGILLGATGMGLSALLGGPLAAQAPRSHLAAAPPLGITLSEEQLEAGVRFLRKHPSVDIHCHPGRFFLRDVAEPTPTMRGFGEPFEAQAVADMRAGGVSAGLFAAVADMALLEFAPGRGIFAGREFGAGEAWEDCKRQIAVLHSMLEQPGVVRGRSVRDVRRAHRRGCIAAVFAVEGGDFIEDRIERVHQAHDDGVRAITIVHYHVNQIGDIQTSAPHHERLTPVGAEIVRAMNEVGIIIDLAHAPLSVVRGAVDVSTRPLMISHTNLATPGTSHPRQVSEELARLVASGGGIVGSVPWGIAQSTFGEWIDSILHMVERLGVDHVAIGTDMDANFMPVFTDYRMWHLLPSALLSRGLSEMDVAKILGGNFLRVFAANGG